MSFGPTMILAPKTVRVTIALEPVYNVYSSMLLLSLSEPDIGFSGWVMDTLKTLDAERLHRHRLAIRLMDGHFGKIADFHPAQYADFPAYLNALAAQDPFRLRDQAVKTFSTVKPHNWPPDAEFEAPDPEALLTDLDVFLAHVQRVIKHEETFEPDFEAEVHALLNDPETMLALEVSQLGWMWEEVLAPEWERISPVLRESVEAFSKMTYSGMNIYDAIQTVTGRDLRGILLDDLSGVEHIILIPSIHTGPYVIPYSEQKIMRMIFGARMPEGMRDSSPTLSRSELLVRLNALADDTRLLILELLTQHKELCAQEIIARLNLSQSSASRHLRQLTATEYLHERRREGAKCYRLSATRVEDTLSALSEFLLRK